jgi:hypothetical protein
MSGEKDEANQTWAQTIWRLRKFRRWSQDRLALELQSKNATTNYGLPERREHIVRVIQRWEAAATLPSDEYGVLLVVAFALPDELANGSLTPDQSLIGSWLPAR